MDKNKNKVVKDDVDKQTVEDVIIIYPCPTIACESEGWVDVVVSSNKLTRNK